MKVKDFISKCIQEYPSLYKDVDYEKSKLKVLNHVFFTIGNGLEMAETGDPLQGGYVVTPRYKKDKVTCDWVRVKDAPYGVKKYKSLPDNYFDSIVYYVYAGSRPLDAVAKKNMFNSYDVYIRYDKKADNEFDKPRLHVTESTNAFSPHSISKYYSIACNVFYNELFLQDDWMEELVLLCKRTFEYFKDEEQYKNNTHYPSDFSILGDVDYFKSKFEKQGLEGLNKLQEIWGYEIKETIPNYSEVEARHKKSWEDFHSRQLKFLTEFLDKFAV
mgnify:FL=1|jgi:hypothetical protein